LPTIETNWGKVPATQSLIYAFDTNADNRVLQDIGLDGLNNQQEATRRNNSLQQPTNKK
jgi:cell surface protein SprA